MKTLEHGHVYELATRSGVDGDRRYSPVMPAIITFVNREPGHEHDGTTTQEVVRALIDRTHYCDYCLPWSGNALMIQHLRMVLALHEARALVRKVERGEFMPEFLPIGPDGHWQIKQSPVVEVPSYYRDFGQPTTETGSQEPGQPCHTPKSA